VQVKKKPVSRTVDGLKPDLLVIPLSDIGVTALGSYLQEELMP